MSAHFADPTNFACDDPAANASNELGQPQCWGQIFPKAAPGGHNAKDVGQKRLNARQPTQSSFREDGSPQKGKTPAFSGMKGRAWSDGRAADYPSVQAGDWPVGRCAASSFMLYWPLRCHLRVKDMPRAKEIEK